MAVLSGVRVGAVAGDSPSTDDPSALPMSSGAAWFPLLPVATPGLLNATSASVRAARGGELLTEKSRVRKLDFLSFFPRKYIFFFCVLQNKAGKSSGGASKTDNNSSNLLVRSIAAALFGAMTSSEWFGGSS
jgi:hypothetical protein